jgi:DNA-binding MarR family transcriptional regulator
MGQDRKRGTEDPPLTVLLRAARRTVADRVRHGLDIEGFSDLPPNGPFVLSALAFGDGQLSEVMAHLGITKQAASQLVDSLVSRGYLERSSDPTDGRRLTLALTGRGEQAAGAVRSTAAELELAVRDIVGEQSLAVARRVLIAIIEMGAEDD